MIGKILLRKADDKGRILFQNLRIKKFI